MRSNNKRLASNSRNLAIAHCVSSEQWRCGLGLIWPAYISIFFVTYVQVINLFLISKRAVQ